MKLREYFDKYCVNIRSFAKHTDLSLGTLYKIMEGNQQILLSVALKIEDATDGKVTCKDLKPTKPYHKSSGRAKKPDIQEKQQQQKEKLSLQ